MFSSFPSHTLAPFEEEKIKAFVTAWYNTQKMMGRVDAVQAQEKIDDLTRAALDRDLLELSSNPMMLTTMAIIHQREIGLPKERVRLYHLAVDVLLRRWQKRKTGEGDGALSKAMSDFLKDDRRLREVMERLAFEAHRLGKDKKEAADLDRGFALKLLEQPEYLGAAALADEFLNYVDERAGLLVGQGADPKRPLNYSFPHRSFQEYLAGCYLVSSSRHAWETLWNLTNEGDYWARAAQLGAEERLYNGGSKGKLDVLDLAYGLCPVNPISTLPARRACLWSANIAALLGSDEIAQDKAHPEHGHGPVYLQRLLPRTQELLVSDLTPAERAEAGIALARLGDERKEVATINHMQFCFVPRGPFCMGSVNDDMAWDDEKTPNVIRLMDYDYWISRLPITNAQFEEFVQAGGYHNDEYRRFWQEAEKAGVWQEGRVKGLRDDEPRSRPHDFGAPFNLPNHPVVGITWYEMLAFTRWLTVLFQRNGWISHNIHICLPSEAEWEKAARGGEKIPDVRGLDGAKQAQRRSICDKLEAPSLTLIPNPDPQRRYPWGPEPDPNRANYTDSGIGSPSTVGCFSLGTTPYGCEDMSGNVWEWTRSLWEKYPYPDDIKARTERENLSASRDVARVVRGGAFHLYHRNVRCAFRYWYYPNLWYFNFGFRVAALPLL
ncbi:hypothetical protein DCC62_22255 [candidate division KSB1 bacterium]|nr:MAG: hypothetical protein DCC62_22255 [candidate division KSB1 bacterium]